MRNASIALFVINLFLMESSMKKTPMHTAINATMRFMDLLVPNVIKPSLTELQSLLSINTGIEITSLVTNVINHFLMESFSKMKENHFARNIIIKEEELSVENVTNQLMECASLLWKKWHQHCFTCSRCNGQLSGQVMLSEGKVYCPECAEKL